MHRECRECRDWFLKGLDDDLAEVAKDGSKFASTFGNVIADAATHIYLSALPFCPLESWIARLYGPQFANVMSVTSGRRVNWDMAAEPSAGHDRGVNSIVFFPDGRKLASGSDDGTVRVWDPQTGKSISPPFTGHTSLVLSVAVSLDGKLIASGSSDNTLRIWDSNTGACPLGPINAHNDDINSVAFSPNGSRIATGSDDNTVKIWNVATGNLCLGPLTGHTNHVLSVTFSPDGRWIVSGSADATICIWDASTGESSRQPLDGHTDWVRCVAFSADSRYLASGSDDKTIRLWDATQGFAELARTSLTSWAWSVSFSPNSNCLVLGSVDGSIHFWDVSSGSLAQIGEVIHGHRETVWLVAFSPDGLSVASGSNDKSIKIWTAPSTSTQAQGGIIAYTLILFLTFAIASSRIDKSLNVDLHGHPVLSDKSFMDKNGWVYDAQGENARALFWVPEENRGGFRWPRNTTIIHRSVTKIDFNHFAHDENWTECRMDIA